jgi:hypothetical protein
MGYKVVAPIQHDGEVFVPGDELSESEVGGKENLRALLDAGVVEEERDEEEVLEPPPNYQDADMRLGGDSASLLIDLPTPTNVPQPVVIAREPEPGTLGLTSPQAAVFQKMQEKRDEEEQLTLEEAQEQRDEDQEAGADAVRSAAQGGEMDVEEATERRAARRRATPAPSTVTPPEGPSPAQAAGPGQGTQ